MDQWFESFVLRLLPIEKLLDAKLRLFELGPYHSLLFHPFFRRFLPLCLDFLELIFFLLHYFLLSDIVTARHPFSELTLILSWDISFIVIVVLIRCGHFRAPWQRWHTWQAFILFVWSVLVVFVDWREIVPCPCHFRLIVSFGSNEFVLTGDLSHRGEWILTFDANSFFEHRMPFE